MYLTRIKKEINIYSNLLRNKEIYPIEQSDIFPSKRQLVVILLKSEI
jgi:hypothetical protein